MAESPGNELEAGLDADLDSLLDTLVPRREDLPGAGGLGLAAPVRADAQGTPAGDALRLVLAALPGDFGDRPLQEREELLAAVEAAQPAAVAAVVDLAYTAYYSDPRVLVALQQRTGYTAEPPQPAGHELPEVDYEAALTAVRAREPFWRSP